jgi:hypothetical protein
MSLTAVPARAFVSPAGPLALEPAGCADAEALESAMIVPIAIAARFTTRFRPTAHDQAWSFSDRLATDDLSRPIRHKADHNAIAPASITPHTIGGPSAGPAASWMQLVQRRLAIIFFLIILYGGEPGTSPPGDCVSILTLTDKTVLPGGTGSMA